VWKLALALAEGIDDAGRPAAGVFSLGWGLRQSPTK
jgi:hypothetical protein